MNKIIILMTVLVLTISFSHTQQMEDGQYRISGHQVYIGNDRHTGDSEIYLTRWVRNTPHSVLVGNMRNGILDITLPIMTGDRQEVSLSERYAAILLANIERRDYVNFRFQQSTRTWVFFSDNTGQVDTLENFIAAGYRWYGTQDALF